MRTCARSRLNISGAATCASDATWQPTVDFLLDAGSGPVQYPEYLTYSQGYPYRVCADISIVALQEARRRLGGHALCVVADVANLPFSPDCFDGVVSLHTLHHLPLDEQGKAYDEIYRVLVAGRSAAVVNGWTDSALDAPDGLAGAPGGKPGDGDCTPARPRASGGKNRCGQRSQGPHRHVCQQAGRGLAARPVERQNAVRNLSLAERQRALAARAGAQRHRRAGCGCGCSTRWKSASRAGLAKMGSIRWS